MSEKCDLNIKRPWQVGWGHRVVKQAGGIHSDKRADRPGKGGRKRDQVRKRLGE